MESARSYECAGCGGELSMSDTVIAWWPIHPVWVSLPTEMAYMHERCAARVPSFEVKSPRPLSRVLADS